jgi:ethanolamine utilization protein EutA
VTGGRRHQARFTAPNRQAGEEDRLVLTSVGVDIGSSTSHLLFSRLELKRVDARYVTSRREVLHQSEILLTPYQQGETIDGEALGRFVEAQYRAAGLAREEVDSGALILTGVALLRRNARTIAELFAAEAGRFVAVSAGDRLEATMAAHGSGAVALSETRGPVMNVDIGGGTTKVAVCRAGRVDELLVLDVGARLVALDDQRRLTRLEPAGDRIGKALSLRLEIGQAVAERDLERLAQYLAEQLAAAIGLQSGARPEQTLLRTPPLTLDEPTAALTFSGGVAEYLYGRQARQFGDLGPRLAAALRARLEQARAPLVELPAGIRATVLGASQFTLQVSGSTIYLTPLDVVPIRNVPVVRPEFPWAEDELTTAGVTTALRAALERLDLLEPTSPVAVALRWSGSATYDRLDAFCRGLLDGQASHRAAGHPLVLVCETDLGGLLGLHLREELSLDHPIVSIDGVELRDFDYVDVGEIIPSSGAVPVVIKSLVFPVSRSVEPEYFAQKAAGP